MKPSEIRAELLDQHRKIRELMSTTRDIGLRANAGEPVRDELYRSLAELAERVRHHNAREEELLQDLISTADAWGDARTQMMTVEHRKEHERFSIALVGALRTDSETAGFGVVALVSLLRQHIEYEEATFLSEEVLRDDLVVPDQSDG